MKAEFVEKENESQAYFEIKIDEIKRKCTDELNHSQLEIKAKLKKEYGKQINIHHHHHHHLSLISSLISIQYRITI